jgi:SpoVK/Ycf46/Vps4 family AAA+-type ATPase
LAWLAVGIAAYSFYLTRRNEQRHSLEYVSRLLNDNAHRNARRTIYNLYEEKDRRRRKKILWVMGVKVEDLDRMEESTEIVKADFDEIGSLIENKSVPGLAYV